MEEQHEGVSAVAAAILDHKAEPLGAIGIIGPSFRLPEEALHALGREVIEAARRIAGNVGELAMSIAINPRPVGLVREDVRCVIPGSDFLGHACDLTEFVLLGNVAIRAGQAIDWDSERMTCRGLPSADRFLRKSYRVY